MKQYDQSPDVIQNIESSGEKEKIDKLREIMRPLWKPGFLMVAHGTSLHIAESIIDNGLKARSHLLGSTAIPLFLDKETYEEQPDSVFKQVLHWVHRDYKCLVVIQIPHPDSTSRGGPRYYNDILEELPEEKKVNEGIQGIDVSYVISPVFIQGYIDVENLLFIKNPAYDEKAKMPPPLVQNDWPKHTPSNKPSTEKPVAESKQATATTNIDSTDPNNWVW